MLALSCSIITPLEPVPDSDFFGSTGGFAGRGGESGGGGSGIGGTGGDAGNDAEGGTPSGGVGGEGNGGQSGGAPGGGSGARGGTTSGNGGQGGTSGSSAEGGTSGSGGDAGSADVCELEDVPYAADDPDARGLSVVTSHGPLGVTARADPVVVPRKQTHPYRYRAFALNARNEFVYADIEGAPEDGPPSEWIRIGSGNDYLFSPPAVAATDGLDRMWVFGVASDRNLHYSVQQDPFNGPWLAPSLTVPSVMSSETWSNADIQLSDEALSASASALGNVLIAARCYDHRACIAIQPVEAMDSLTNASFMRLAIESDFQPALIEAAIDQEAPPQVYIAITSKDGTIHYAVGSAGADSLWREEDFVWARVSGMCFESAPTLVAGGTSVDLFARGTDGAIYRQPLKGEEGLSRISFAVDTHPLVIGEGTSGLLVFAVTDGAYRAIVRRFWNGGWTEWASFDGPNALVLGAAGRPFPGAALKVGRGVRLVVRGPTSELREYSFVEGMVPP